MKASEKLSISLKTIKGLKIDPESPMMKEILSDMQSLEAKIAKLKGKLLKAKSDLELAVDSVVSARHHVDNFTDEKLELIASLAQANIWLAEMRKALEIGLIYIKHDMPKPPNHICGPESSCDADCVAYFNASRHLMAVTSVLSSHKSLTYKSIVKKVLTYITGTIYTAQTEPERAKYIVSLIAGVEGLKYILED